MISIWIWIAILFFVGVLATLEMGYKIGRQRNAIQKDEASNETNVLSGSVYALLTLLLAFSFSLAVQRFEARRHLIVDQANAIGTAYLRIDLLPESDQPGLRHEFERFTDAQIAYGKALSAGQDGNEASRETLDAEKRIWTLAMVSLQNDSHESNRILISQSFNQMFDNASAKSQEAETRTPQVFFVLLISLSLASALLAGKAMAGKPSRSWGHRIIFAGVLALVLYVIWDLDDPRQGAIRINGTDKILYQVRDQMK